MIKNTVPVLIVLTLTLVNTSLRAAGYSSEICEQEVNESQKAEEALLRCIVENENKDSQKIAATCKYWFQTKIESILKLEKCHKKASKP